MYRTALLAVAIVAWAPVAKAQQPTGLKEIARSPLQFYLARGDENACGTGCSEWIAVEGNFDRDAPARFLNFLSRLGPRKMPIYFNSTGGLQAQAITIGKTLRERGLVAGVAKTLPEACLGGDIAACESAKKSGRPLSADWSSVGARCNSSCLWALVGARERQVPLGSSLGVHAARAVCIQKSGTITDAKEGRCQARHVDNAKSEIRGHLLRMGIDSALVEVAFNVPHDRVHYLSRDEIMRFGIDHSAPKESAWMLMQSAQGTTMVRFVKESSEPRKIPYVGAVQIGCNSSGRVMFSYSRRLLQGEAPSNTSLAAILDGRKYPFTSAAYVTRIPEIDSSGEFARRELWLSQQEVAASRLAIEIRFAGQSSELPPFVIPPSTDGFARAWQATVKSCGIKS